MDELTQGPAESKPAVSCWTFPDIPFGALFRPKWERNELWPIEAIKLNFARLAPASIGPALVINRQTWPLEQLPEAFEYTWDGKTFYGCFGTVAPRPAAVARLAETEGEVSKAIENTIKAAEANQTRINELTKQVDELVAEFLALNERKTADEAKAGAAPPQGDKQPDPGSKAGKR